MMSLWFDFGLTLNILNLSLLRFNERSESENLVRTYIYIYIYIGHAYECPKSTY